VHAFVDHDADGRLVKRLITDKEWDEMWYEIWRPFFESKTPDDPDAWDIYRCVMDDTDKYISIAPIYDELIVREYDGSITGEYDELIAREAHYWAYRTSLARNSLRLHMLNYGLSVPLNE